MLLEELTNLIDEAITLEKNVGRLYQVFAEAIPEDKDFWMNLFHEESMHAEILETVKDFSHDKEVSDALDYDGFLGDYSKLKRMNNQLEIMLIDHQNNKPTREIAAFSAMHIEQSGLELTYNRMINTTNARDGILGKVIGVLKMLNAEDKNHYLRIAYYFKIDPLWDVNTSTEGLKSSELR